MIGNEVGEPMPETRGRGQRERIARVRKKKKKKKKKKRARKKRHGRGFPPAASVSTARATDSHALRDSDSFPPSLYPFLSVLLHLLLVS